MDGMAKDPALPPTELTPLCKVSWVRAVAERRCWTCSRANLSGIHSLSRNVTNSATGWLDTIDGHVTYLADPVGNKGAGILGVVNQGIKKPFLLLRGILGHGVCVDELWCRCYWNLEPKRWARSWCWISHGKRWDTGLRGSGAVQPLQRSLLATALRIMLEYGFFLEGWLKIIFES
jgi:hypothetical protein